MIDRPQPLARVTTALRRSRVVALVGPRQSGKTTLARILASRADLAAFFDLEDPGVAGALEQPMATLAPLKGLVVIDEVQRRPDLFPTLRVLADRTPLPSRFLVLGSASPELLRQASESLAGRIEVVELSGFSLAEVGAEARDRLWLRGGLPLAFTAERDEDSFVWRRQFIQTFLERDIPQLGVRVPSATLLRFWTMLAHYHAQTWNAAELARSLGAGEGAVRHYLDLLESLFLLRVLRPWHANLAKRQVKSPKVVVRDMGLLHALLGVRSHLDLVSHPKCGASWEGFAIEQVIEAVRPDEAYFWATHNGAELDLFLRHRGRLVGVECKRADTPRVTPSIRHALADLGLDRVWIVYPGDQRIRLDARVEAIPIAALADPKLAFEIG
ncbi:MAG: ATP-binding protein [Thermoanaerobaculaceae bacterium]|nr:ATP-binding protein [Thermoanaerobaculaceae bacterium]